MRYPSSQGYHAIRRVIRHRQSDYDIERPSEGSTGRFGDSEASTTTVSGVPMWLHEPEEVNVDTEYGDRLGGDLQGLALPSADVQVHDRIPHGGETYEVERVMHLPDNNDQQIKSFALQRRTND